MKKIFLSLSVMSFAFLASCGNDDNTNQPVAEETALVAKWSPNKMSTTVFMQDFEYAYPHSPNCQRDYISLEVDNVSRTYMYDDNCQVEELVQTWTYQNNDLTITVFGYQITGRVITNTENTLVIESDISQYAQIISQFTEFPIPEGTLVQLHLDKIN